MGRKIDKIDAKIICLLQKNGRMPNKKIAKKAGISEATVRNRLQRLLDEEYIQIVAVGNPFKLGFGPVGNIKITADIKLAEHVAKELKKINEVWYVGQTTGSSDFDVEFHAKSFDDLYELLLEKIGRIKGVVRTETSFVLRHIKYSFEWGTPYDDFD